MGKARIVHLKRSEATLAVAAILPLYAKEWPRERDGKPIEPEALRSEVVTEYLALVNLLIKGIHPAAVPATAKVKAARHAKATPTGPVPAAKKAPKGAH